MNDGPSRNKPCPCGSAKKYKLCCADRSIAACYCGSGKPVDECHMVEHGGPVRDTPALVPMAAKKRLEGPAIMMLMPTRGRPTVETLLSMAFCDGIPLAPITAKRMGVVEGRNALAHQALKLPANAGFEPSGGWYALWIDDDAFWSMGTFAKMVGALSLPGVDIVAGWFSGRKAHSEPKAYREDGSYPRPGRDGEVAEGGIAEISRCGFHFVMHRLEVLEKVGPNPFTLYEANPDGTDAAGEDFAFCARARAAGLRIWVHTGAKIAHIADDGVAYLPGEPPMRVQGSELIVVDDTRTYGDLDEQAAQARSRAGVSAGVVFV